MFNGLMKSKFYTKCKSSLKMTKTRLEALKKKKNSVGKYLKNDMAELIKTGLDYNAYCRAEGLLAEQNLLACYNFIEKFCDCIFSNFSLLTKQKDCPDECKEAVQSLIYATARFSEFLELKELRTQFLDRYGTSLESFINKEFVEILKQKVVTKEMKLQLMHDIAQEYCIEWDAKSLEQKLFRPPPPQQDLSRTGSLDNSDHDRHKWKKNEDESFTKADSHEPMVKESDKRDNAVLKRYDRGLASNEKKTYADRHRKQNSSEDEVFSVSARDSTDRDSILASSSSVGSVSEDEVDSKTKTSYRFISPPYTKPGIQKEESKVKDSPKPTNNVAAEGTGQQHHNDSGEPKQKPRSVRRRPSRPPPGGEDVSKAENMLPLRPPPGREILSNPKSNGGQQDEEEKIMDDLLMHYSRKASSDEPSKANSQTLEKAKSELPLPPGRAAHSEDVAAEPNATTRRHVRALSLQSEALSGHVHPNLPDFDELAARVAALKGR